MLTVHLSNLLFHGFHGVYMGEAKVGNDFEVDVMVKYDEGSEPLDNLNNLVSYEMVYEIVKKRMAIPSPLLEEVAEAMIRKIKHQYQQAAEITISIFKLQPPMAGFQGKAGITLQKMFK